MLPMCSSAYYDTGLTHDMPMTLFCVPVTLFYFVSKHLLLQTLCDDHLLYFSIRDNSIN